MKNCLNFLERELRGTANKLDLGIWENSKIDPESAFLPTVCLLQLSVKLEFSLAAPICTLCLCSGGRALIFASALPGHWRKDAEELLHGKSLKAKTKLLLFH